MDGWTDRLMDRWMGRYSLLMRCIGRGKEENKFFMGFFPTATAMNKITLNELSMNGLSMNELAVNELARNAFIIQLAKYKLARNV